MGYLGAWLFSFDYIWDLLTCQPVDLLTCHPINEQINVMESADGPLVLALRSRRFLTHTQIHTKCDLVSSSLRGMFFNSCHRFNFSLTSIGTRAKRLGNYKGVLCNIEITEQF